MTDPQPMRETYSRLAFLLEERGLTPDDVYRQIRALREPIDLRTIQRLTDPDRPLKHVETRILDAICRVLGVEIGDLLVFAPPLAPTLRRLPADRQRRLDALMDAHVEGQLDPDQGRELAALVAEADDLDFANTQRLVEHRQRLREGTGRVRTVPRTNRCRTFQWRCAGLSSAGPASVASTVMRPSNPRTARSMSSTSFPPVVAAPTT